MEVAVEKPKKKLKKRLCQGTARRDEPCERPAQRRCTSCGLWFCRSHFPDSDWHSCAPDQGTG
jgi:hypothetical protein